MLIAMFIASYLVSYFLMPNAYKLKNNGMQGIVNYYSFKGPKDSLISFYLRLYMIIDYIVVLFVYNSRLGLCLYNISYIIILAFRNEFIDSLIFDIAYWYALLPISCSLSIYIFVQFEYTRELLREVIGPDAFKDVLGNNPGTENIIKTIVPTVVTLLGSLGLKYGYDLTDFHSTQRAWETISNIAEANGEPKPSYKYWMNLYTRSKTELNSSTPTIIDNIRKEALSNILDKEGLQDIFNKEDNK